MEATLPESEATALPEAYEPSDTENERATSSPARFEEAARRLFILIALYTIPAIVVMRPVDDPDLWWHPRTGQWIVAHGIVPMTDPFPSFGHEKPWIAYSWLFEMITYGFYKEMGLPGILLFRVALVFAVAVAIHRNLVGPAGLGPRSRTGGRAAGDCPREISSGTTVPREPRFEMIHEDHLTAVFIDRTTSVQGSRPK